MSSQPSLENVLRFLRGVSDVAAIHDDSGALRVFAVPDCEYTDPTLARTTLELTLLTKWKKVFDLTQFTKLALSAPVGFNTSGWNSSYTRQLIPGDQMRDWLESSIAEIMQLAPKRVCEVGCGTGMLLLKIAPLCERYLAIDFSRAVLNRVREQLQKVPELAGRVEILERAADNLGGLEPKSFDTVVINSVAQYFPDSCYLTRVLENAVGTVADGGQVFIGDVQSLPLLPLFASSVVFFQAGNEVSIQVLRERVQHRIETLPELMLSPAYFLSLQSRLPRISRVEIRPRLDRSDTEMSRYRYQAILSVAPRAEVPLTVEFLDVAEHEYTLNDIASLLRQSGGSCIGIKKIGNARLAYDLFVLEKLRIGDATHSAGDLRRDADQQIYRGCYPWEITDLGASLGYEVSLSWRACRADGSYDALFIPKGTAHTPASVAVNWPDPEPAEFVRVANAPGQGKIRADLVDQLLAHCRQILPQEAILPDIFLVDTIVRKSGGAVDFDALLAAAREAWFLRATTAYPW